MGCGEECCNVLSLIFLLSHCSQCVLREPQVEKYARNENFDSGKALGLCTLVCFDSVVDCLNVIVYLDTRESTFTG